MTTLLLLLLLLVRVHITLVVRGKVVGLLERLPMWVHGLVVHLLVWWRCLMLAH